MDLNQYRLTDEEIAVAVNGVFFTPTARRSIRDRPIADAATEKALRVTLLWLQSFENTLTETEVFIGLGMAADELKTMLTTGQGASPDDPEGLPLL